MAQWFAVLGKEGKSQIVLPTECPESVLHSAPLASHLGNVRPYQVRLQFHVWVFVQKHEGMRVRFHDIKLIAHEYQHHEYR